MLEVSAGDKKWMTTMQYEFGNSGARAQVKCAKVILALLTVLVFAPAPARAFDSYSAVIAAPIPEFSETDKTALDDSLSPTMTDSCLPLLKSLRQYSPNTAMDRNQRPAGKAAALGVVFGLRFALGPTEDSRARPSTGKVRLDVWQPAAPSAGDRHALAVSDWRQCQKNQALKAFRDSGWKF